MTDATKIQLTSTALSAGGVVVGIVVTQIFEIWKRREEQHRLYATNFLPQKIAALHVLNDALSACPLILVYVAYTTFSRDLWRKEILSKYTAYGDARFRASIYFTESQDKTMLEMTHAMDQANLRNCVQTR